MNRSDLQIRDYLILRGLFTTILEDHLQGAMPMQEPEELRAPKDRLTEAHHRWLLVLDLCATPAAMRVSIEKRSPPDRDLEVLLEFFMTQNRQADHDRFEWLLTYVCRRHLEAGDGNFAAQILEMFPHLPQTALTPATQTQVDKLLATLDEINACTTLLQLTSSALVAKGRELKEGIGAERYRPAVLVAVVKYNLVLARAFRDLFGKVAQQNRDLSAQLVADYRDNVAPLQLLAASAQASAGSAPATAPALAPTHPSYVPPAPATPPPPPPLPPALTGRQPSRAALAFAEAGSFTTQFQVDSTTPVGPKDNVQTLVERRKLRTALETLLGHFSIPENKASNAINTSEMTLVFEEWEARALATEYAVTEKSFRAEFVRMLKDSAVLLYRISDESGQLKKKSQSEYHRKPHEESLGWLYVAAQDQIQTLRQFAGDIAKRGLPEKQQQILITALRLQDILQRRRLRTTADPFGEFDDTSLITKPDEILSPKKAS